MAGLFTTAVDDAHDLRVRAQLHLARQHVDGALLGVALLEQKAAAGELLDTGLLHQRLEILRLEPIEGGQGLEQADLNVFVRHRVVLP